MVIANVPISPVPLQPATLQPLVAIALIAYLVYSIWSAYSTGVNKSLMRKTNLKGVVSYGPYLSLIISFVGIGLVLFVLYELIGYYIGFIRFNLPSDLSSLDFFSFLIRQFTMVHLRDSPYVIFLVIGLLVSCVLSYLAVRFLYRKGLNKAK